MTEDILAMVFVNCDIGEADGVVANLRKLDKVIEVCELDGAYHCVAKVKGNIRELQAFVQADIRDMKNVRATLTLAVSSSWSLN